MLLYSNGITENYNAKCYMFTEKELVFLFSEYKVIKTKRLITVLNTWCIWGENEIFDPMDLNRISSDILEEAVYSHCLFVHDSELNPDWKVTDNILYRNYQEALADMRKLIDSAATDIINEYKNYEEGNEDAKKLLPVLETLGPTKDKRILFSFKPNDQYTEFYENEEFNLFSKKVYDYIHSHTQDEEPFTIYADKKAIIIVNTLDVPAFIDKILEKFKKSEQYEICKELVVIMSNWNKMLKKPKLNKKKSSSDI
jgi:hypothetical protein